MHMKHGKKCAAREGNQHISFEYLYDELWNVWRSNYNELVNMAEKI